MACGALALCLALTGATNPGFVVRITQAGLDYGGFGLCFLSLQVAEGQSWALAHRVQSPGADGGPSAMGAERTIAQGSLQMHPPARTTPPGALWGVWPHGVSGALPGQVVDVQGWCVPWSQHM